MPNVMVALPNIGGTLCSTPQFGWRLLLECRAVTLPRRKTRWNLQGCPKLTKWSQPLVGQSSPYCGDMWSRYCCLTTSFLIVDTCRSCKDIARQSCAMLPRWQLFDDFLLPAFAASRTCILNLHQGHTMCGNMVDIQSATAEIRRRKNKEERKKKPQDENIMVCALP